MEPSDRWKHLKSLFDEIVDLDPAARAQFLDDRCGDDAELRRRLLELLHAHDSADSFLASPTAAEATAILPSSSAPGQGGAIGPYRLLEQIGEGGFGVVYIAEQRHPIARRVALKVLRPGMDTQEVIARFESERQALAILDHPGIAKVFDAGVTEQGRPYFAMEYVAGVPITTHCDERKLSIPQRLELFAQVCDAVQHAHQRGIIHRDIKPSNVLVTMVDDRPAPKIIDFGVAKATGAKLSDRSLYTQHGLILGTPEYMSPEQAGAIAVPVDTRSDVYALGILLYELLVGARPFEVERFKEAALAEVLRVIREEEAPKLTTRLSSLGASASEIAQRRQVDPRALARHLQGDLEWITGKALEKEPARRYASASEFAADVRRHLANEPVVAGPPGGAYRLRKFVRRNKAMVGAVGAVFVALLVGATTSTNLYLRAEREAGNAHREAAKQKAVSGFLAEILSASDPAQLYGDSVTVLQATQEAIRRLDAGSLKEQPEVEAAVRTTIGVTLTSLSQFAEAETTLRTALEINRRQAPAGSPEVVGTLCDIASVMLYQGRFDEAEPLLREAIEIDRKVSPTDDARSGTAPSDLGSLLHAQGKLVEAEPFFREAITINRGKMAAGRRDLATSLNHLGRLLQDRGEMGEVEALYREALDIRRNELPAGHPDILTSLSNMGWLLQEQGKSAEAEQLYREAVDLSRRAFPADHPHIAASLNNLGQLLQATGQLDEAERVLRESLGIARRALPAGHPGIALSMNNLAGVLKAQAKLAEAESLVRDALAICRRTMPDGHRTLLSIANSLASLLQAQERFAEAEPLNAELYRAAPTAQVPAAKAAMFMAGYGPCLVGLKRYAEAELPLQEASRRLRETDQGKSPMMRQVLTGLVEVCDRTGRPDQAGHWREELEALGPAAVGDGKQR